MRDITASICKYLREVRRPRVPPARPVREGWSQAIFIAMTLGREASRASANVLMKVSMLQAAM
jgi:hypothetical protein